MKLKMCIAKADKVRVHAVGILQASDGKIVVRDRV